MPRLLPLSWMARGGRFWGCLGGDCGVIPLIINNLCTISRIPYRGIGGDFFLYLFSRRDGFGRTAETLGLTGQEPALLTNRGQRYLGGGEEAFGLEADDHLGHLRKADAGDVVADVFESGEGRHAAEIGGSGSQPGVAVVLALGFRFAKGVIPGVDTAQDGGVFRSAVVGFLF